MSLETVDDGLHLIDCMPLHFTSLTLNWLLQNVDMLFTALHVAPLSSLFLQKKISFVFCCFNVQSKINKKLFEKKIEIERWLTCVLLLHLTMNSKSVNLFKSNRRTDVWQLVIMKYLFCRKQLEKVKLFTNLLLCVCNKHLKFYKITSC